MRAWKHSSNRQQKMKKISSIHQQKSSSNTNEREVLHTKRFCCCVSKTCLHTIHLQTYQLYIYIDVAVLTVVVFTCGRSRKVCIVLRTDNVYCQEKWSSMRFFLALFAMKPFTITWHRENWNCRGLGFSQFPLFNRFTGKRFSKQSWFSLEWFNLIHFSEIVSELDQALYSLHSYFPFNHLANYC